MTAVGVLFLVAWLWRNRRLSDGAVAKVVVGFVPVACLVYALMTGASMLVIVVVLSLFIPGWLLYGTILDLIREQGALQDRR